MLREEQEREEKEVQEEKLTGKALVREIFSWILTCAGALVAALFVTEVLIVNATIPTGSMENTIMSGTRLFGSRLTYLHEDPDRFDIIVFKFPDDESVLYVKRIIGLPGETVEVRDGLVYINGSSEPLRDDFIKEPGYGNFGPYTVPEDAYFVMGDNRNNSWDSRYWTNTFVHRDKILGKAYFSYWPLNRAGVLH